ncbi:SNF2 family N-terminal domain-containing protein [Dichomitus squalens]|nr:SNF2 family N-terminal domain-containing protein [Dichomitus squalens]
MIHDSDSDSDIQEVRAPTRKSTRARKTLRSNLDDEDFEDNTPADSDSSVRPKAEKKKKAVRGKASRPAYGHFRVVADLELDEEENEDIAPLIAHRAVCEKCQTAPTHEQARKKGRKRKAKDEDSEDEETRLANLGGWNSLKCPVAAHWGCLAKTQRDEILRAAQERDKAEWLEAHSTLPEPGRRLGLDIYQTTEFICGSCMKGGICMGCKEVALKPDAFARTVHSTAPPDLAAAPSGDVSISTSARASIQPDLQNEPDADEASPKELLFRCLTCKRLAHYAHLPVPDGYDPDDTTPAQLASYYQESTGWRCADCFSYVYSVEHILAWRPYPENAVEPPRKPDEPPNYKSVLPREYLIKWVDRSYRRVEWVPHGWLLAVAPSKLKNFLLGGAKVPLLPEPTSEQQASAAGEGEPADFDIGSDDPEGLGGKEKVGASPLIALPDAEKRIPPAWKTVDRILEIKLWKPRDVKKGTRKSRAVASDEEADDNEDASITKMRAAAYDQGEEPSDDAIVTLEEFESLTREKLSEKHASQVAWAFIKWDDLGYDDASWDSPPRSDDASYAAFVKALERFIAARSVNVSTRGKNDVARDGARWLVKHKFTVDNQPKLGQSAQLKLMPFQVEGVNWLCHNWNTLQHCILADEMGLGKTVQIVTFIGYIVSAFKCFPALVVVPNSTITNWVREFERWAPKLRVVPFYGDAKAREIIKKYELFHSRPTSGTTGAKYHVLVTTYETITNTKEFGPVFKSTPSWEMLVVDEGQRLKSDASLIFKRLKELKSKHRIIMTGTPLNNNIRELFNLMNFLDPDEWADLEALSKQYEELTDELVADLHTRLKPYFLRRIKSEVLQLPPKNEVIVPVSMAPLQKEIYRSILSQNLDILRSLTEPNASSSKGNVTKTNMNNMLMQLRKCVQHPYLVSPNIEPKGLSPTETHERLIGASAKLRLLKTMLPKLRARGHRVLLFSQFAIALDIIEDFLVGEGITYLRLDGNTKQADRQKGMDEFNKKDSDVFIYLLTTRAGGVGINLWSADTVIIFDPDFNPHQDLQAIARAHRYGQTKTVLVFKLMVKDSAEERIMQTGKKKLILDHLIVQKMDDESGSREDVQSILLFGAKALFEETEETVAREVHYSEHDIDNLIEKTEKEGDQVESESGAGSLFSFAKVWSADKEGMEELAEEAAEQSEQADAWTKALELIAHRAAAEKEKEQTGRGVRRKAAAVFPQQTINLGDTPTKNKEKDKGKDKRRRKSKGKSTGSDDSDFHAPVSDAASDSDGTDDAVMDVDDIRMLPVSGLGSPPPPSMIASSKHGHSRPTHSDGLYHPLSPVHNRQRVSELPEEFCGLCGNRHAPGQCSMTESPENLATYRLILLSHAGDETIEERRAAIRVIDETLHRLGKIHLIYGQPLHLVETPPQPAVPHPPKKPKLDNAPRPTLQAQITPPILHDTPNHIQLAAGPSRLNGTVPNAASPATAAQMPRPVPRAYNAANAVASSSKALTSLAAAGDVPRPKKAKLIGGQPCAVCGHVPHHLVKDCPVVAQGPLKINDAIQRLASDPSQEPVVDALRSILTKQQRRVLAVSAAKPSSIGPVIDLTES